jgi:trichoplein keratin filament-binding protein
MKSARLHAAFVRKREADQLKQEKSIALQRYYDKWGRITSQYEHWSTPQYYKASEESSKNRLQKEQKQKSLEERQAKLKQMLDEENQNYEREMKGSFLFI